MRNTDLFSKSEIADRGWADMRRTLDREMPQKRKRRIIFWIFLCAAALVGAGLLVLQNRHAMPLHRPVPPAKTVAPVPKVAAAASVGREAAAASTRRAAPASKVPAPHRQLVAETTPAMLPAALELPKNVSGTSAAIEARPQSTPMAETLALFLPANELPAQVASVQPAALRSRRAEAPPIQLRKTPSIRPIRPAIYAAARLNPASGALSPSAGLLADWRWSGRFGLRAGVGYQYERFPRASAPGVLLSETAYSSLTGDDRVLDNNSALGTGGIVAGKVLIPIASLHRLELPLQVYWQAHPRWRAYAGVQWQYTFQAQGMGSVVELDTSRVLLLPIGDTNRLAAAQTRGWAGYFSLGLSHAFSRRMELALQYHARAKIPLNNRLDYDPAFNLADQLAQYARAPYDRQAASIRQFQLQAVWKF
jgi:hypothetical protein